MNNYKIINKSNLINNIIFCKQKSKKIMAMVKANAYGHNYKIIAKILKKHINYYGVANEVEALKLRMVLPSKNILIVGKSKCYKSLILNKIQITVDDINELYKINIISKRLNKKAYVHIAINTGMNRIGVKNLTLFKRMLNYIKTRNNLVLKGVFTHCFDADYHSTNFYNQMKLFENFVKEIKDKKILIHIGGSYTLNYNLPSFINMVRVGLFLYGYGNKNLKPVMQIESRVIKITSCKKGEFVGYGKTKIKEDKEIALIPIGYADGLARNLSNVGYVLINNKRCKIVGRVCMDMFMCDITNKNVKIGDKVNIMINATTFSKAINTNEYEVLTNFSKIRAKTVIYNQRKILMF